MANEKKVALNRWVLPDTFARVKTLAVSLGIGEGDVVDRAVAGLGAGELGAKGPDLMQKVYERQLQIELKLEEILETVQSVPGAPRYQVPSAFDPASIPGVRQGVGVVKRYSCEHCGRTPAVARVGEICGECRGEGHLGEPRDCGMCTAGVGA